MIDNQNEDNSRFVEDTTKQRCYCEVHRNQFTGIVHSFQSRKPPRDFLVYRVYVRDVPNIFNHQLQLWNHNHETSRAIFGNYLGSAILRSAIRTQHAQLYQQYPFHFVKSNYLTNGDDFLKLIKYGKGGGKRRFFTYVILENRLLFSESGHNFLKNYSSKHAMHANCQTSVYYAGEFHVQEEDDPSGNGIRWKLIVDNNSGTYAPSEDLLPNLALFFRFNFPGIVVEALPHNSPLLEMYKKKLCSDN